jgi:hypothetical protein
MAQLTLVGAAVMAAIGYVLPAHRLVYVPSSGGYFDLAAQPGEAHFHSLLDDSSPVAILVLLAAAAFIAGLMRTRRLGTGMFAGVLGTGGAILAIIPTILVHLFSRYESGIGDHMFILGVLLMFFVGIALFIAEPVMFLLERRRIERASRPAPLPVATVVSAA